VVGGLKAIVNLPGAALEVKRCAQDETCRLIDDALDLPAIKPVSPQPKRPKRRTLVIQNGRRGRPRSTR
jgi:hypothetical protein